MSNNGSQNGSIDDEILFEVNTPISLVVRTTVNYWNIISTVKHPIIRNRQEDIQQTLSNPDEIRFSKTDSQVLLFYRYERTKRWLCAVVKRLNGEGFLITAYITSAIKEGVTTWKK